MVRLMKSFARAAARDHDTVSRIYFSLGTICRVPLNTASSSSSLNEIGMAVGSGLARGVLA
jgi:hypothetical protein